MKEASHKGPHIISFHLYEMFRIGKYIETETSLLVALGLWGEGDLGGIGSGC